MEEPIEIDTDPLSGFDAILQAGFSQATQVPGEILRLIPAVTISVSSLLATNLPVLLYPSATNLQPAKSCVTDLAAHWTVEELLKAPVPPRRWLGDLEITLKNEWFKARAHITSVRHPTVSNLCLPLWAGNLWYSLVEATEQKEEWRRAECWISSQVQDAKVYEARELMGKTPWGTRIWALAGANSFSFVGVIARILLTDWLGERHLDTLGSYLNFRASKDKKNAGECWVGETYLSVCLKKVYRVTKKAVGADRDLNVYRDAITAHGYKCLLFPANLNNNHWIVFSVDLKKEEFCFGASYHSFGCRCTCTHWYFV